MTWLANLSPTVYSSAGGWALCLMLVVFVVRICRQQVRDVQKDRDERLRQLDQLWREHTERLQSQVEQLVTSSATEKAALAAQVLTMSRTLDGFVRALPPGGGDTP